MACERASSAALGRFVFRKHGCQMSVRATTRRGRRVLVIDRIFQSPGGEERYRHDAQVQTRAGADAEERRLVVWWTEHGTIAGFRGEEVLTAPKPKEAVQTWDDAVKRYRDKILPTLKLSTKAGYEELLDHGFSTWAGKDLATIDLKAIQDWDSAICQTDIGASRRRNFHVVMRNVLHCAKSGGLLGVLPEIPKLPKVGTTVVQVPHPEDIAAILGESRPKSDYLWRCHEAVRFGLALSVFAGLRAAEVRGIRVCDVDLRKNVITVRTTRSRVGIDTPKSGNERPIPIAEFLLMKLAPKLEGRPPGEYLAVNGKGEPWGDFGLYQGLQAACERLGVPRARFHALRHAFVTGLFDRGVPAQVVQALAGHATLSVTQRYAHHTMDQKRAAIAALANPASLGNSRSETPLTHLDSDHESS